ncbi:GntR family transcriptional regulator [Puniceibacterium confluentis]|uniref:GntR family transcriptional regulator n=1 Tax=Puniceibacterium confluentis TaxID=1958944 RepID=UPI0011B5D1A2|nr:GntR family transcriptional regulator [Puniceibacterium confluentis]
MRKPPSRSDGIYREVKEMAARFDFKPDERINESELSVRLNVSRTPLREALNRLASEGFLTYQSGQGFFCRSLNPLEIRNLYEARAAIESEAVRLATQRASDTALAELEHFARSARATYRAGTSPVELVRQDQDFHLRLAQLSGNAELLKLLENINARIHYIRLIDLQAMSEEQGGKALDNRTHERIVTAMLARDSDEASRQVRVHIEERLDEVTNNVKRAFSLIYVPQAR